MKRAYFYTSSAGEAVCDNMQGHAWSGYIMVSYLWRFFNRICQLKRGTLPQRAGVVSLKRMAACFDVSRILTRWVRAVEMFSAASINNVIISPEPLFCGAHEQVRPDTVQNGHGDEIRAHNGKETGEQIIYTYSGWLFQQLRGVCGCFPSSSSRGQMMGRALRSVSQETYDC